MLASYGEVVQCVITSRLPVADLIDIDSHRSHTVGPLGPAQAVHVLRDLGVEGDQATLLRLADDLDRHALSLTLAGAFIRRQHDGDPSRFRSLDDLPSGHTADDLTRRVERILEDYGGLVSDEQLALLQVLAVHRVPVREVILDRLTQPERGRDHLLQPLTSLATRRQYEQLVDSLADMGLVMRDEDARTLSCHVLVKGYFARKVTAAPSPRQREFYWAIARAHLRHVAPATYGKLGLGTAGFLGALAMRRVLPQTLVLAGQAAKGDPMLREALHFIGRMRKVEETSQT
jgi:hypothetical protein